MKCPYCAEEIRDEAIVCRYCGRELLFAKALLEKISSLESQVLQLNPSADALPKEIQSVYSEPLPNSSADQANNSDTKKRRWGRLTWPVLLSGLSMPVAVLSANSMQVLHLEQVTYLESFAVETFPGVVTALLPLICGIWAGFRWHGNYLKEYALLALSVFLVMIASSFIFEGIFLGIRLSYYPLISFSQVVLIAVLQASLFMLGTLVLVFWRREAWSERLLATETKKDRIIVAALITALPWFGVHLPHIVYGLLQEEDINVSPVRHLVLTLSCFAAPLLLGFWAGLQWPGRHFKGYILLGVAAGLSAWIGWEAGKLIKNAVGGGYIPGDIFFLRGVATYDLFFLGGIAAAFFIAGGLFADVLKNKTNPRLLSEDGFAQRIATRLAGPGNRPDKNVVLLVQAMIPTATAFLGFLSALVGLYKAI